MGRPALIAVLCASLMVAGCGDEPTTKGGGGGGGGGDANTVKVGLPTAKTSFANADVAVAQERGFFKEEGVNVEVENFGSGLKVVQGVVAGGLDVGGSSIEPVLNAGARGQGISIIGAYTDRLTVAMVTPDSITDPAQLKGKTLGIQDVGAFREIMTRTVLEEAGLTPQDVQYRPVESTGYTGALLGGQIQSGILQQEQVFDAIAKDDKFSALVDLYEQDPDYFYGTYFANKDWVAQNREKAVGFLAAITKAHRFMYDEREETVGIVAKATGFENDVIGKAYDKLLDENAVFPVNEGLEEERLEYTVDRLKELKALQGAEPNLSQIVDRAPIEEAVKKLGGPVKGDDAR